MGEKWPWTGATHSSLPRRAGQDRGRVGTRDVGAGRTSRRRIASVSWSAPAPDPEATLTLEPVSCDVSCCGMRTWRASTRGSERGNMSSEGSGSGLVADDRGVGRGPDRQGMHRMTWLVAGDEQVGERDRRARRASYLAGEGGGGGEQAVGHRGEGEGAGGGPGGRCALGGDLTRYVRDVARVCACGEWRGGHRVSTSHHTSSRALVW